MLRDAAIAALGPHDPSLAAEILARADVTVLPERREWTASAGTFVGRTVVVAMDAHSLGELHASPATADALQSALAHALGAAGEALSQLTSVWSGADGTPPKDYRSGGEPMSLHRAVGAWLDGAGEAIAAAWVRSAELTEARAVTIQAPGPLSPHDRGVVEAAVVALRGPTVRVHVRVGK